MQMKSTQLTGLQMTALLAQAEKIELLRFGDINNLKQVLSKRDMVVPMHITERLTKLIYK